MQEKQKHYRILSLDGGGSWSVLQLMTLRDIFGNIPGHEVLNHFDLVVANSGGSIVLATLFENWPISKSIQFFQDPEMVNRIFSKLNFWERFFPSDYTRLLGWNVGPKYATHRKQQALRELLPISAATRIDNLQSVLGTDGPDCMICTFDALQNRAKFFRSYPASGQEYGISLADAVHASSNAPVQYFDFPARVAHPTSGHLKYLWDGALAGFNNPVAAAVMEAIKMKIDRKDIKVLSLGTGEKLMSEADQEAFRQSAEQAEKYRKRKLAFRAHPSQLQYFKKSILQVSQSMLNDPPDWANYAAWLYLTEGNYDINQSALIRFSPMIHISPETSEVTASVIEKLYHIDKDASTDYELTMIRLCHSLWSAGLIKNQPISFKLKEKGALAHVIGTTSYQNNLQLLKTWLPSEKHAVES